jgi:hypothetical protein
MTEFSQHFIKFSRPLQLDLDLKYGHNRIFRPILWTKFVTLAKTCLQE